MKNVKSFLATSVLSIVAVSGFNQVMADQLPSVHVEDADGSLVEVEADGTKIIKKPDGTTVQIETDGTKIVKETDGSSIKVEADGSKTIKKADGTTIQVPSKPVNGAK